MEEPILTRKKLAIAITDIEGILLNEEESWGRKAGKEEGGRGREEEEEERGENCG